MQKSWKSNLMFHVKVICRVDLYLWLELWELPGHNTTKIRNNHNNQSAIDPTTVRGIDLSPQIPPNSPKLPGIQYNVAGINLSGICLEIR